MGYTLRLESFYGFGLHLGFFDGSNPRRKKQSSQRTFRCLQCQRYWSNIMGGRYGASDENQFLGVGRSNRKTALSGRNVMDQTSESAIYTIRWPSAITPS